MGHCRERAPPGVARLGMSAQLNLDAKIAEAPVVFFDLATCPFCRKAEACLQDAGIAFLKVPIGPYKSKLLEKTGKTSAPSVWIKGTYVGGCNDGTEPWHGTLPLVKSGKFQEMMSA